jgi:hypothetical protein
MSALAMVQSDNPCHLQLQISLTNEHEVAKQAMAAGQKVGINNLHSLNL